ncbi:MAG: hypothetical protein IH943_08575 [Acidobacteria bacterium]|nr:hypothetical protein [Acidobacteriota bacterium]
MTDRPVAGMAKAIIRVAVTAKVADNYDAQMPDKSQNRVRLEYQDRVARRTAGSPPEWTTRNE